jgi:predicted RNase H-like HicB family nuclease
MAKRIFHVVLKAGQDGWLVARCVELPAAISQGKTRGEALANIREAIELVLEEMNEPVPQTELVAVEVTAPAQ